MLGVIFMQYLYKPLLGSNKALCKHSVRNLDEARNVCAGNKVALNAVFLCSFAALVVNVFHNAHKLAVNILKAPGVA